MTSDFIRKRVIHAVLERQMAKYDNRIFLYFQDQKFGYRDFDDASNRVACGLQKMGIVKGDKVAILMDNCPEFLFLWFGISKLGAIEVPLNTAHKGELFSYFLYNSDARVLVLEGRYIERVLPLLDNIPTIETVVVINPPENNLPQHKRTVLDWISAMDNNGRYEKAEIIWSDPFAILYTSGTTGPSKGAVLPHNYALHMGETCIKAIEYDETDCLYNALPLFHGNAQLLSFMPALMSGARTVLAERFSASSFWHDIKRYGCTEFNALGGILPILFKADPKPDDIENPLKKIFSAATPADIYKPFEERFGVRIIEGYGMSEIGLPLMNSLDDRKARRCGKILPDCQVKVVDEDGMEVGPHEPGEILVRPLKPFSMMLEYYKMPERTVEAWRNLWFHTGDSVYYDEDGYYYFVDRKKDSLRRRGENISSYEVEQVVNSHPAVLESAAVAAKSELGEDEVMICLVLKSGRTLAAPDLIRFCEKRMAYFMVPRYVRIMSQLPKTATERVKKSELRAAGITPETWDRDAAGYKIKR
jgi:crotonobetaine/carnitine-CoA ligase